VGEGASRECQTVPLFLPEVRVLHGGVPSLRRVAPVGVVAKVVPAPAQSAQPAGGRPQYTGVFVYRCRQFCRFSQRGKARTGV